MGFALTTLGVLMVALGAIGVLAPKKMTRAALTMKRTPGRLYGAAAVRAAFGLLLIFGAPLTVAPMLVRVVGIAALLAVSSLPVLGVERVGEMLDWFGDRSPLFLRGLYLAGALFGWVLARTGL